MQFFLAYVKKYPNGVIAELTPPGHIEWKGEEMSLDTLGGFEIFRKIQYGRQIHGLVIQTFFLWKINRKFFFLAWGFHILATQKNNFCHLGGSQWAPGGLLARFRAKNAYFETNLHKNQNFLAFYDLFLPSRT